MNPVAEHRPAGGGGFGCENDAREGLLEAVHRLAAADGGGGLAGNVSLRWHRGGRNGEGMLITPAAVAAHRMRTDNLVWLSLHAQSPAAEGQDGPQASSEWRLHRDLYVARPRDAAVVHTHSPYATALACLPAIQRDGLPATHYMIAVSGGDTLRCAPYHTYGSQALSDAALIAMRERFACLLAHHGVLATGASLDAAVDLALEIERLSRIHAIALAAGTPAVLSSGQLHEVLVRFGVEGRTAGQMPDATSGAAAAAARGTADDNEAADDREPADDNDRNRRENTR